MISRFHASPEAERETLAAPAPDISVVVACYNAAETVSETLQSLRTQAHAAWEAICVDDGSNDATPSILQRFAAADPRFRVISRPHAGQPAAKNAGFRAARAPWVMVLDADDRARPAALAALARAARVSDAETVLCPAYQWMTQHGEPLPRHIYTPTDISFEDLLLGNRIPPMALLPRELALQHAFDETLPTAIDWDMWLRLAQAGVRFTPVPRVLFDYRLHGRSLSHNPDRLLNSGRRVLARHAPRLRNSAISSAALHRLTCQYGAMALARGDATASGGYFTLLPPVPTGAETWQRAAHVIRWAFEFAHGAHGQRWEEWQDVWRTQIQRWLAGGPLACGAAEILAHLRAPAGAAAIAAAATDRFLEQTATDARIIIYGAGRNGGLLLDWLNRHKPETARRLSLADDAAPDAVFAAFGLPRADPRRWMIWPEKTCVLITPVDSDAIQARLVSLGGAEGVDFAVLSCTAQPPTQREAALAPLGASA